MKVVYISPVGVVGGAERVLLTLIDALAACNSEVEPVVVTLADGPLVLELRKRNVETVVVPLSGGLQGLGDSGGRGFRMATKLLMALPALARTISRLAAVVRSQKPDIIHTNGIKAHLLGCLVAPRGVSVVWHLHDFIGERRLAPWLLRMVARRVGGTVAISEAVAADARRCLPSIPVTVIPNGIDLGRWTPGVGDGAWLERQAGFAESAEVRVGLVATYALWKGHDTFLKAASLLGTMPGARFFVVGGPIYTTGAQRTRGELEAMAKQLGLNIGFIPHQDDMAAVYRSLDVVVHASNRPEPFGLVIAEAMACGRAVVVSRGGGAVELFSDGVDAVGHTMGDARDLARVLIGLIQDRDKRDKLGEAAAESARQRFGASRQAQGVAALYQRINRC
jgi:glycosyltransferase involved in cell wall biosynthesis